MCTRYELPRIQATPSIYVTDFMTISYACSHCKVVLSCTFKLVHIHTGISLTVV